MQFRTPACLAAGLALAALAAAPPAPAAPVTVDLRIEGPTRTIFEGPVTTDVRPFRFTGETAEHRCDGTTTGGTQPEPVPTRAAVVAQASEQAGFAIAGTFGAFGITFVSIGGERTAWDPDTSRYLVEYENGAFAALGACADDARTGDDVLFAYGTGSEALLALRGPAGATAGTPFAVRVADGAGDPVAGASVGGATTGADGAAIVGPFPAGTVDLKATKPGAVRSNRLRVAVASTAGGPPAPAQPGVPAAERDTRAPLGRILGIREQEVFPRRRAPRVLRGRVSADPSGIRAVKLRLTRQAGRRCWRFSGTRERFLRRPCGRRTAFSIGTDPQWSYLLPERLRRGRYVLDAIAVDRVGNRDRLARGRSRVVFHVR